VLRQSSVGKDMAAQVEAMVTKMEADIAPEGKKLQVDTQALQKQLQVLSADVRQQKIKEIEGRRAALQRKIQDRESSIQGGLAQARQKVEQALGPVLEALLKERGANLLLDRGLVVLGQTELDITSVVIARLNSALPKVAVTLAAPQRTAAAGAQPKPAAPAR
jgi:Skp family chaperone for outer membrane proteins